MNSRIERLKTTYQKVKHFYFEYERLLMPGTLVVGFIVDYITFTSIQIRTTFFILTIYWILASLTIVFLYLYDAGKIPHKFRYPRLFAPLLLQFFFGALLGASFIFYWFSSSFSASWLFLLLIVGFMVSNDVFRDRLQRPLLQISFFYFVSLSLLGVALPFAFNSISPWLFVGASAVSLLIFYAFIRLLTHISAPIRQKKTAIYSVIVCVLAVMNIFYFTNVIPPVPLALRDGGVYYNVERSSTDYILTAYDENILEKILPGRTIPLREGESLYAFTAVYAPSNLNTRIYHNWQYYDTDKRSWVSRSRSAYTLTGGRREGFRGYTYTSNLIPGTWRVSIETERHQVIARMKFKVKQTSQAIDREIVRK